MNYTEREVTYRLERAITRAERRVLAATKPEERTYYQDLLQELREIRDGQAVFGSKHSTNAYAPENYLGKKKESQA